MSEANLEPLIEIENLTLTYESEENSYTALQNINLTINRGEFICIVGSSGCGKSTLLSVLEGLHTATSGSVKIRAVTPIIKDSSIEAVSGSVKIKLPPESEYKIDYDALADKIIKSEY